MEYACNEQLASTKNVFIAKQFIVILP